MSTVLTYLNVSIIPFFLYIDVGLIQKIYIIYNIYVCIYIYIFIYLYII